MDNFAGYYPESHTSNYDRLDKIAIEIVHGNKGEFLRKFADVWLSADVFNKMILRSAFLRLIKENGLEGAGR